MRWDPLADDPDTCLSELFHCTQYVAHTSGVKTAKILHQATAVTEDYDPRERVTSIVPFLQYADARVQSRFFAFVAACPPTHWAGRSGRFFEFPLYVDSVTTVRGALLCRAALRSNNNRLHLSTSSITIYFDSSTPLN